MVMDQLLFCGDPHGQFEHIFERVRHMRPKAVILLGDLDLPQPFETVFAPILGLTEVWFIHGNHDTDHAYCYDHLFHSALSDRNLHGKIMNIGGVRIAGLGGVFRGQIWYPPETPRYQTKADFIARCGKGNRWRGGLPLKHRSSIFPDDLELFKGQKADILVCHEAPSAHPHGFAAIDDLADSLGVKQIIHGHHHEPFIYADPRYMNVGFRGFYEMSD